MENDISKISEKDLYLPPEKAESFRFLIAASEYGPFVFADSRIPMENVKPVPSSKMPPYIITKERMDEIVACRNECLDAINQCQQPVEDTKLPEIVSRLAVCKIINLINALIITYNFHRVKNYPSPGITISQCLDPHFTPDLFQALIFACDLLAGTKYRHAAQIGLSSMYKAMCWFFELLRGMNDCNEINELQNAYASFQRNSSEPLASAAFAAALMRVSQRFDSVRTGWEKSKYENPSPLIAAVERRKPGRKPNAWKTNKEIARIFAVNEKTISRWLKPDCKSAPVGFRDVVMQRDQRALDRLAYELERIKKKEIKRKRRKMRSALFKKRLLHFKSRKNLENVARAN